MRRLLSRRLLLHPRRFGVRDVEYAPVEQEFETEGFEMAATLERDRMVRRMAKDALSRGVPESVVRHAEEVSLRWANANKVRSRVRVDAYFWSIVRRRVFEHGSGQRQMRDRFVAASLVQDLREAGLDEMLIADELRRWGYEWSPPRRAVA